jgi:GcrA cell cycle regulator
MHAEFNTLNLTQRRAAQLFRVGERSVRRWRDGSRPTPVGVDIVLRLMVMGAVTIEQVEAAAFPVAARTNGGAEPEPSAPVDPEPEQSVLTRADLSPAALAILALGPGACRWPLGNPKDDYSGFCFCARPIARGFYCEQHDAVAHMPRGGHDVVHQLAVA